MRKLAIVFFIFITISALCFAQSKDSATFLDFKWGDNQANISKQFTEKGYKPLSPDTIGLIYSGSFAGEDAEIFAYFHNDQFYMSVVLYSYESNRAISKYTKYRDMLIQKYGNPDEKTEVFYSPYYRGDGYEEQAIRMNKGFMRSAWDFKNDVRISTLITSDLQVVIIYTYLPLDKEEKESRNKKNMGDL